MSTSVNKIVAERNHRILLELVLKPGNDICADCKVRTPRWASHNLGIFLCMNCASIHRKIGTHVTKVKSITLDEWSKEQVEVMKEMGNTKSNALYNPNEARHPPPTNMIDSERDSELERFIRSKYEFKRFMDRKSSASSQKLVPDLRVSSRSRSVAQPDAAKVERKTSPGPLPPPKTRGNLPPRLELRPSASIPSLSHNFMPPARSVSQPLPPLTASEKLTTASPLRQHAVAQSSIEKPAGQVWEDLISLQEPSQSSSVPLQYSPMASFTFQPQFPVQQQPTTPGSAPNPFSNLSVGQTNTTTQFAASSVPFSTPGCLQFPFASNAPLPSPSLHPGTTNPFNRFSSPVANVNGTAFSASSNPFSPSPMPIPVSMTMSASVTQQVTAVSAGTLLHSSPLPYVSPQTSAPPPALSFQHTPFTTAPAAVSFVTPVGASGQIPPTGSNPFSAMQMGQAGHPATSLPTVVGATAFFGHQQPGHGPTHGFGGWAAHGTM